MAGAHTDPGDQHDLEQLKLPEPASGLWKRIRTTVHELGGRRRPDQEIEPHIGGGTTLAARWGHRTSTDIDITLPGDPGLGNLTRDDEHNLARRIGGTPKIQNIDEIKIQCSDGVLHLARLRPYAAGAEKHAIADGKVETVLSTSQILRGKLRRGLTSPVRDVFDMVCAAKADPRALATAASMLETTAAEKIATKWKSENKRFEGEAKEELYGVSPEFETDLSRLGTNAAKALETHRYQRLQIEVDEREVAFTKTVAGGPLKTERYPVDDARGALRSSGIEEHLEANGTLIPVKVAIAIDTMVKYGRSGILYDSDDRGTRERITFPEKHFDPKWKPLKQVLEERRDARNATREAMTKHTDKLERGGGEDAPAGANRPTPATLPREDHRTPNRSIPD